MATFVSKTEEVQLQNGEVAEVRPLNIKKLRKFMEIIDRLTAIEKESDAIDILVDACEICLEKSLPELVKDRDALEEALDNPTIEKILEIAGGIKMNDPNLLAAAGLIGKA